ncbi:gp43 [Listeria phage P40]|uniref:gp43 n=1 Tax=Listeria phage P40 TaxID=560178 RepID=UPI00018198F8|nr:gp43 [Listeria phage P40]ACI00403.1 gp43 [Listeria phage P40]
MNFKVGDKVNFIDKGRLHTGIILDVDTKGQTNFKVGYDTSDRESRKSWLGKVEVWVSESHLAVSEKEEN